MEREIKRRRELCERADTAGWESLVAATRNLAAPQKEFVKEHPPGLVNALWGHFDATRDRCGCATPAHERPGCQVPLIEKLLLEEEVA
jgi:hypothetical protein